MKIRKMAAAFIVFTLIIGTLTACNKQTDLKINVSKGDKYKVTTAINRKISMKVLEQDLNVDQDDTIGYIFDITDVDNTGTITVNVKYDYMAVKQTNQSGTMEYDSRKSSDKNNPLSQQYNAIIGQSFTFKMNNEGQIIAIEGIDKLISSAVTKFGLTDAQATLSLSESLKENFGQDVMKETLTKMMDIYPGKKVQTGDTWKKDYEMQYGIPMKLSSTMKFKDSSQDIATVDVDSSVSDNPSGQQLSPSGVNMNYDVSGTEKGTLELYKSNGFIKEGNISQNLTGTVNMGLALVEGDSSQGMAVPVKITNTITYKTEKQ